MGSPSPPATPHSRSTNPNRGPKHDDATSPAPLTDTTEIGSPNSGADAHQALTSQSLNADGTPKRPMNAFMIFARRRRPQVSAANQMMRTGEISKILSREWNAMAMVSGLLTFPRARAFFTALPICLYPCAPETMPTHARLTIEVAFLHFSIASIHSLSRLEDCHDRSALPQSSSPPIRYRCFSFVSYPFLGPGGARRDRD